MDVDQLKDGKASTMSHVLQEKVETLRREQRQIRAAVKIFDETRQEKLLFVFALYILDYESDKKDSKRDMIGFFSLFLKK